MKEIERDEILEVMREAKQPLSLHELADQLVIEPGDLEPVLIEMEMKGYVILTRKAKYGLPEHMNLRVGRIQRHQKVCVFNYR